MSLAPFVNKRPWLKKMLMPVATWYANASGYRQLGLRYDDLYEEEREAVQLALKRLSPKEAYERVYRLRRATQCSYQHKLLPRADWTTNETVRTLHPAEPDSAAHARLCFDVRYLSPIVRQVEAELAEKDALDAATVIRKAAH
ncbi:Cytochrome b-c1 complex subunit 7 [Amphichorda felina]